MLRRIPKVHLNASRKHGLTDGQRPPWAQKEKAGAGCQVPATTKCPDTSVTDGPTVVHGGVRIRPEA